MFSESLEVSILVEFGSFEHITCDRGSVDEDVLLQNLEVLDRVRCNFVA